MDKEDWEQIMLQRQAIQALDDYFRPLSNRPAKGVYVYRINGYTNEIETFIKKYYEQARRTGVVIEGRLPNPDEKQLAYYEEIMGLSFELSLEFMKTSLRKWLLRMHEAQRNQMAEAMYEVLLRLKQSGKTENMLKNAYIKFMCWLYYKLERVVNQLGSDAIAKILYEGEISNYELLLLSVLARPFYFLVRTLSRLQI